MTWFTRRRASMACHRTRAHHGGFLFAEGTCWSVTKALREVSWHHTPVHQRNSLWTEWMTCHSKFHFEDFSCQARPNRFKTLDSHRKQSEESGAGELSPQAKFSFSFPCVNLPTSLFCRRDTRSFSFRCSSLHSFCRCCTRKTYTAPATRSEANVTCQWQWQWQELPCWIYQCNRARTVSSSHYRQLDWPNPQRRRRQRQGRRHNMAGEVDEGLADCRTIWGWHLSNIQRRVLLWTSCSPKWPFFWLTSHIPSGWRLGWSGRSNACSSCHWSASPERGSTSWCPSSGSLHAASWKCKTRRIREDPVSDCGDAKTTCP